MMRHPSTCLIVGQSQSGKTSLVRKILKNNIYDKELKKIKWCYTYSSPWFLEEPDIEFIQGLPEDYTGTDLIVIDDFMHNLNMHIAELFTAISHHCCVSVILILQNLFPKCKVMRDISLNSHYILLFKNSRDMSQINCFGRQLYPGNSKFVIDAYKKATEHPFAYLVVDLHPLTKEEYRLRESLFPDNRGIYWVYRPK